MTMTLLEIAKILDSKVYIKGVVGDKIFVNTPKDGSTKWKMLTFVVNIGSGKYIQHHKCIAWDNEKNNITLATDFTDLAEGELILVSGEQCKNNEYKNKEGMNVHSPQFTITNIVRLGIPTVQDEQPTSDVDLDDDESDKAFL